MKTEAVIVDKGLSNAKISFRTIYDRYLSAFVPIAILVLIVTFFSIMTEGALLTPNNIKAMIAQSIIVAIVSTGATFIFASGNFDVSLGFACSVSAIFGAKAYLATGASNLWLMGIVCIISAMVILTISSTLSAVFKLPVFIVTIAMMSVLISVQSKLLGGMPIRTFSPATKAFELTPDKYYIFIAYFIFCVVIMHLTKTGRAFKLLGSNRASAEQTGISPAKYTFIAFLLASIGVGLGAFLTITRAGSVSSTTGASLGMDVMIAIVLGGMPISGGAKSNIFSATLGAVLVVVINLGLTIMHVDSDVIQATRGIVFLAMVVLFTKRTVLLPR